jgi:hypothetical protein
MATTTSKSIENHQAPKLGMLAISFGEDEEILKLDEIVPIGQDLSDEFSRQPSLYAYVAMIAAQTESMWMEAKQETERVKARTDKQVRQLANATGEKITETMVSNRVILHDDVIAVEEEELSQRLQYMLMKAIVNSMEQRAQMLISLGAHLRAEADQTGMLIKDTKAALEAIKRK